MQSPETRCLGGLSDSKRAEYGFGEYGSLSFLCLFFFEKKGKENLQKTRTSYPCPTLKSLEEKGKTLKQKKQTRNSSQGKKQGSQNKNKERKDRVSNTKLIDKEFLWPSPSSGERAHWVPFSLLFVCQSELIEIFAEVSEFGTELSKLIPRSCRADLG